MTKKMLIDATHAEETRVAVVDGNRLVDYDYESKVRKQLKGSIFLAKVTRVEPSLQAAFVNFGGNRHGFLPFSEIHPDYFRIPIADREALLAEQEREMEARRAEEEAEEEEEVQAGVPLGGDEHEEDDDEEEEDIEEIGGENALSGIDDEEGEAPAPAAQGAEAGGLDGPAGFEAHSYDDRADEFTGQDEHARHVDVAGGDFAPDAHGFADAENGDAVLAKGEEHEGDEHEGSEHAEGGMEEEGGDRSSSHEGSQGEGRRGRRDRYRRGGRRGRGGRDGRDRSMGAQSRRVEMVGGDGVDGDHPMRPTMRRHYKIQEVVKRGQIMLIQVSKEERGNKGAAVTTYLSLPGRYCVLMPNSPRAGGVSRKIASANERKRMREILSELQVGSGMSVIMRTAGMSRNKTEIKRDLDYLTRLWDNIRELTLQSTAPAVIHEEGNLIRRAIRDIYGRDVEEIEVSGEEGYKTARDFMKMMIPSHVKRVNEYKDEQIPLFHRYQVENQIFNMGEPSVTLKSGGYIVINPTEALVSIDVNSGRATKERHIEETALKTNLEAADEVARQLRLRDLGGLIVIDFIDMEDRRNNRKVEQRLKDALSNDRARIQIGRISSFGLLELSRQRLNPSLTEAQFEKCDHCKGVGHVRTTDSAAITALRAIEDEGIRNRSSQVMLSLPSNIAIYMLNHKRAMIADLERRYGFAITVRVDEDLAPAGFKVESLRGISQDDGEEDETPDSAAREDGERREGRDRGDRDRGDRDRGHDRGDRDRGGRGGRDRGRGRGRNRGDREDRPADIGNEAETERDFDDNVGNEDHESEAGDVDGNRRERHDGQGQGHGDGGDRDRSRGGRRRGRRGGRRRNNRDRDGENSPNNFEGRESGQGNGSENTDAGSNAGARDSFVPEESQDSAPERSRSRRRDQERGAESFSQRDESAAPAGRDRGQDAAPEASAPSNDVTPPPARDFERVNEAPEQKKKGWWNRLTE